jgi:hypothetical protein
VAVVGFAGCVIQEACSFNGAWRGKPSSMARVYYVSSYFWDRALDSGIISDKNAISWKTSPGVSGCTAVGGGLEAATRGRGVTYSFKWL